MKEMAMAESYADLAGTAPAKLTKSRNKAVVKPILKKMGPQSAKSSLDIDRAWEEQIHYGSHGWGGGLGVSSGASAGMGRDRDVSFTMSTTELDNGGHTSSHANIRSKYSHARSTSGASHASIATSSGSGPGGYRTGSFVHPFQQTPRTSTPPLSYANSLASLDQPAQQGNSTSRDYSPTITEDEDLDFDSSYNYHHRTNSLQPHSRSLSQSNLNNISTSNTHTNGNTSSSSPRRPSLASQRTSSLSDVNQNPLRINTSNRSTSISGGSRLANVSSTSDVNLSESYDSPGSLSLAASPPSATAPVLSPLSAAATSPISLSTSASASAMGLRTSLEGFRLRSRSELGSDYHQERIRIERQKWQDKERAKQQKRDDKEHKRRARADHQRTTSDSRDLQAEAAAEALIKARAAALDIGLDDHTFIRSDTVVETKHADAEPQEPKRRARSSEERRRAKKQAVAAAKGASLSPVRSQPAMSEKSVPTFASRGYTSVDQGREPTAQGVAFGTPQRGRNAKRKTQSAWTTFTLWFKSLLLKSKRQ